MDDIQRPAMTIPNLTVKAQRHLLRTHGSTSAQQAVPGWNSCIATPLRAFGAVKTTPAETGKTPRPSSAKLYREEYRAGRSAPHGDWRTDMTNRIGYQRLWRQGRGLH
jgi:hypothetical protein